MKTIINIRAELINAMNKGKLSHNIKANNAIYVNSILKPILKQKYKSSTSRV